MIKITLETGCINIKENHILDQIFDLAEKGQLTIFFSDAIFLDILDGNKDISDLPANQQIPALKRLTKAKQYPILKSGFKFLNPYNSFPIKFPNMELFENIKNIMPQSVDEEDIRHLVAHKDNNNDFFITNNTKHFINNGIREKFENIGINIKTPIEFLNDCISEKHEHPWDAPDKA